MTKRELREFICDILEIKQLTPVIESQINRFVMELEFSYKEIAQALAFFIEIKGGEYQPMYGIGVLPNIMEESNRYFYKLRKQKEEQLNSIKEAKKTKQIVLEVKKLPKRRKKERLKIEEMEIE